MKTGVLSVFYVLMLVLFFSPAQACTLWAATGELVEGGGSLIVKNRDWLPDHDQVIKFVAPDKGNRYIGLFAVNGDSPGLKAAVNEKALVVISATAGSIPAAVRKAMPRTKGLLTKLITECGSVDEVLERNELFRGPQYIMVADRTKAALIEVGPDGKYSVTVKDSGVLYHTNHYLAEGMAQYNAAIGISSAARYERIQALLNDAPKPLMFPLFLEFSNDRHDGPDNSIFRTGSSPKKTRTMAIWAVAVPRQGFPLLHVRIFNPGQAEQFFEYDTGEVFGEMSGLTDR